MKSTLLSDLNIKYQNEINKIYNEQIKLVFGNGSPDAQIVLIGEAPGKQEVLQGKPFVGQAGKNLDEFINLLDIKREDLYITNIVKLRPYKINPVTGRESNRPPTKKEITAFTDFIIKELSIIAPKLVVTLGNVALKCILKDNSATIGIFHGEPLDVNLGDTKFKLFPLYHPASIIYRAELRKIYLEDLMKLKSYMEYIKLK